MEYKVGDRVRIREDLIEDESYGYNTFTSEMMPWRGQVATIASYWGNGYLLEDGAGWIWCWLDMDR